MTKDEVLAVLHHREQAPVELAIAMVNLSRKEEVVVDLCGRKRLTQSEAAEELDKSLDAVQKWWASAIKKLGETWDGMQWVRNMTRED